MKNIGIDIGGTFIKAAVIDENGKICHLTKTPTGNDGAGISKSVEKIINDMIAESEIKKEEIAHVGIGAPGLCNSDKGIIINCPNINGCTDVEICKYLEDGLNIPVFLDNDANCAALGEYSLYREKPRGFVFITLGTGLGGGIILDGKLLRGVNYAGGEIGHIVMVKNGEKCNCGRRGCWEKYASVSALIRYGREEGLEGDISGKSIFEDAKRGVLGAERAIDRWLECVAEGICDMVNIFQPDKIVIGGGISREGDRILEPIRKYVYSNSMIGEKTEITVSQLFNEAGVIGAGLLYTQN